MARVKLRCIMGCPGLRSSYREKGLFQYQPKLMLYCHIFANTAMRKMKIFTRFVPTVTDNILHRLQ